MAQTAKLLKVFKNSDYAVVYWERNKATPYVACWHPRIEIGDEECADPEPWQEGDKLLMYWSQGHYFSNGNEALIFAAKKEVAALENILEEVKQTIDDLETKYVPEE